MEAGPTPALSYVLAKEVELGLRLLRLVRLEVLVEIAEVGLRSRALEEAEQQEEEAVGDEHIL